MKITRFKKDGEKYARQIIKVEAALQKMQLETKDKPVSKLRDVLCYAAPDTRIKAVDKIPLLIFGCETDHLGPETKSFKYNGLVILEVNGLADANEAVEIRTKVSELPQTMIAFIGSSGKSVKFAVPFLLPNGDLPFSYKDAELFHAYAYREAVNWYQPQLSRKIELKNPKVEYAVRQSFDPELYYNPEASPIRIEQPLHLPDEQTYEEKRQTIVDPLLRILPGSERYDRISALYNFAYWDAIKQLQGIKKEEDRLHFLIQLAENCNKSGIPEEDAVKWTLYSSDWQQFETETRYAFNNIYVTKKLFGTKPFIPKPLALIAQIEEFLKRRYRLRRNTMMNAAEYLENDTFKFSFRSVTKKTMNSMVINAQFEGLEIWDADIKRYLESDRVPVYNPVEEYLSTLPLWDGTDRIGALADRLPCDKSDVWRERFHRWFLSMVVHWMGSDVKHANSYVPLLIGSQGTRKSTFCRELIPPQLMEYYTDDIDLSQRQKALLALTRFLLINIDEFDSVKSSHQGFLKHVIQKPVVHERKPYGTVTETMRRYATFIATSNNHDLLKDPTGSRRFLCVEIKGLLNNNQPIHYQQLYAQAVAELKADTRYWFTHEEELQITKDNRKFQTVTMSQDALQFYFRKPKEGETFEELSCQQILDRIQKYHSGFTFAQSTVLKYGKVLSAMFSYRKEHGIRVYQVVDIHLYQPK